MIHHKFHFPSKEWNHSSDGIDLSDGEINEFIRNCLNSIRTDIKKYPRRKSYHCDMATGNTIVWIDIYKQNNDKYTVYARASRAYWNNTKTDIEL